MRLSDQFFFINPQSHSLIFRVIYSICTSRYSVKYTSVQATECTNLIPVDPQQNDHWLLVIDHGTIACSDLDFLVTTHTLVFSLSPRRNKIWVFLWLVCLCCFYVYVYVWVESSFKCSIYSCNSWCHCSSVQYISFQI